MRLVSLVVWVIVIAPLLSAPAYAAPRVTMVVWIGCEDVCRGVQDYFKESGVDVEFVVRDAAEDRSKLPTFAEEIRANRPDLVITWGTRVTLGIAGALDAPVITDVPIVFTVVADPVGNGIIQSYESTGRSNVTGTRNRVPEEVNIRSIRRYLPAFDHLGMLYDPTEANSVAKVSELKELAGPLGYALDALALELDESGSPNVDSIRPLMGELKAAGVQFVYLGSSTFLEKQRDAYTGAAVANGLPVLVPYEHMVTESQALMSVAARDYDVGKLAGEQAAKILVEGKSPGELPILPIEQFAYMVNMTVAAKLSLYPPVEFLQFVEQVQ